MEYFDMKFLREIDVLIFGIFFVGTYNVELLNLQQMIKLLEFEKWRDQSGMFFGKY